MATITQSKARAYSTLSGNSPKVLYFAEGISQTYKSGALLYLTASATTKLMVSPAGAAFDTIRKRVLGLALADANNTTSPSTTTLYPVHIADGDTIFMANVISRTSAAVSSLALLDVGKAGTASLTSSRLYFDRSGSAAGSTLRCLGLVDQIGDRYGRVIFHVLSGARIFV